VEIKNANKKVVTFNKLVGYMGFVATNAKWVKDMEQVALKEFD